MDFSVSVLKELEFSSDGVSLLSADPSESTDVWRESRVYLVSFFSGEGATYSSTSSISAYLVYYFFKSYLSLIEFGICFLNFSFNARDN